MSNFLKMVLKYRYISI